MPRFSLNVYGGVGLADDTGTEDSDWTEARVEAIRLAGQIFRDDARRVALSEAWRLDVTDEHGLVLFRVDFVSQEAQCCRLSAVQPSKSSYPSIVFGLTTRFHAFAMRYAGDRVATLC